MMRIFKARFKVHVLRLMRAILTGALIFSTLLSSTLASDWPTKPIKLVVPYAPGGGTDILGRMIARKLGDALGVAVVVENRPGSDGSIGTEIVARALPDGYTLLIDGSSQAFNVAFGKKMTYDSARDLAPIVQTANQQVLLMVNAKLPIQSVKDLIAYAQANPGKLSYGASSNANVLPMELFKIMSKTDIVHVPYKGAGPMLNDLLGGQIEISMSGAAAPLPHVRAGSLHVLGIGDDKRAATLPEFPTIAEAGLPGFQTVQWSGMFAPAGTPDHIIRRINQAVVEILKDPIFRQQMMAVGFDAVEGDQSPEKWRSLIAAEVTKWTKIARQAGLKHE
jgi:tripartite-type tricarboxylate transporter receptor subunit TctC